MRLMLEQWGNITASARRRLHKVLGSMDAVVRCWQGEVCYLSSIGPDGVRHCRLLVAATRAFAGEFEPFLTVGAGQPQYAETGAHACSGMLARAEQTVDIGADGKARGRRPRCAACQGCAGHRWCAGGMCSLVVAWCALAATQLRRNGTASYAVIPMQLVDYERRSATSRCAR